MHDSERDGASQKRTRRPAEARRLACSACTPADGAGLAGQGNPGCTPPRRLLSAPEAHRLSGRAAAGRAAAPRPGAAGPREQARGKGQQVRVRQQQQHALRQAQVGRWGGAGLSAGGRLRGRGAGQQEVVHGVVQLLREAPAAQQALVQRLRTVMASERATLKTHWSSVGVKEASEQDVTSACAFYSMNLLYEARRYTALKASGRPHW